MNKKLFLETACNLKADQDKHGADLLFISRLYSRFIEDVNVKDLRKIAIRIIESSEIEFIMPVLKLTKVCSIHKHFNWGNYENENDAITKYKIILNFISSNVLEAAEKFNWSSKPFEDAYAKVMESKFKNEFIVLPSKQSKDKKYIVSVVANATAETIMLSVYLQDKDHTTNSKIDLTNLVYHLDEFSRIAYKMNWLTDDELVISNKNEEISFRVNVKEKKVFISLNPIKHSEEYLRDELKLLQAETLKEERIAISQKRISH